MCESQSDRELSRGESRSNQFVNSPIFIDECRQNLGNAASPWPLMHRITSSARSRVQRAGVVGTCCPNEQICAIGVDPMEVAASARAQWNDTNGRMNERTNQKSKRIYEAPK